MNTMTKKKIMMLFPLNMLPRIILKPGIDFLLFNLLITVSCNSRAITSFTFFHDTVLLPKNLCTILANPL